MEVYNLYGQNIWAVCSSEMLSLICRQEWAIYTTEGGDSKLLVFSHASLVVIRTAS